MMHKASASRSASSAACLLSASSRSAFSSAWARLHVSAHPHVHHVPVHAQLTFYVARTPTSRQHQMYASHTWSCMQIRISSSRYKWHSTPQETRRATYRCHGRLCSSAVFGAAGSLSEAPNCIWPSLLSSSAWRSSSSVCD